MLSEHLSCKLVALQLFQLLLLLKPVMLFQSRLEAALCLWLSACNLHTLFFGVFLLPQKCVELVLRSCNLALLVHYLEPCPCVFYFLNSVGFSCSYLLMALFLLIRENLL